MAQVHQKEDGVEAASNKLVNPCSCKGDDFSTMTGFLNSRLLTIVMTIVTIYALMGDDIRLAAFPKSADDVFYALSLIALLLFTFELVLNSIYQENYLFGFYFWLDLVATVSLLPDIGWIWNAITGAQVSSGDQSQAALKASRASRAGTRAGRFVRIVRLVRLIRIVKLFKMAAGDYDANLSAAIEQHPSRVGKKLTELTTRRMIILVLCMVVVLPILDGTFSSSLNDQYQLHGLQLLHRLPQEKNISACAAGNCIDRAFFKSTFETFVRDSGELFYLSVCDQSCRTTWPVALTNEWIKATKFAKVAGQGFTESVNPVNQWSAASLASEADILRTYRPEEANLVEVQGCFAQPGISFSDECSSRAYYDLRSQTTLEAGLSIVKTCFVMLILGVGSLMFTSDANSLVIEPITRMVNMVKQLKENPLGRPVAGEEKGGADEDEGARYETKLLEGTLDKIGGLLQVGFGEAGAEIISQNMQGGGELNPLLAGKTVTAIFGFCDIRQFTDTTECLQEEVMVYVNKIGDIVHTCTHQYYGAANKNIGDAFLLAWKICDGRLHSSSEEEKQDGEAKGGHCITDVRIPARDKLSGIREISPTEMADSALAAFLKIIVELDNANHDDGERPGRLAEYHKHPAVLERFGEEFEIKMGFGLHVGWAIEGAIGSAYKIDASYLSPNVNMAARLEAATKQFRTPLLLSHWLVELLSPEAREFCRRIDVVTVKGSEVPMTLFTYDVTDIPETFLEPRYDKHHQRVPVNFSRDKSFSRLQRSIPRAFFAKFEEAMVAYLAGDWDLARQELEASLELKPADGPASALMDVIAKTNFVSPEDWQQCRALTEK